MTVPSSGAAALPAEVAAPAKLTLSLRVVGRRSDGFHLLDAEMVTVDLCDRLRLSEGAGLTVTGPFAAELEGTPPEDDLAMAALRLAGRQAHVTVEKHIPVGAGLGGGSADAAAVLRWAGAVDPGAAAALGADVPFCLLGGRARVRGIGDDVEPLAEDGATFTVATPPLVVDTAAVYATWDRLGGPTGAAGNDLEPAAVDLVPALADWRERIAALAGDRPRLAGSGSTWFLEGDHVEALRPLTGRGGLRLLRAARTVAQV